MSESIIGENIKKYRKQQNISQEKLGAMLNTSQQMIAQYEKGNRKPKIETLRRIAEALKVSLYQLADWSEYSSEDIIEDFSSGGHSPAKTGLEATHDTGQKILSSLPQYANIGYKVLADSQEALLLSSFSKLNWKGKLEAVKRVSELTQLKDYATPDE